MTHFTETLLRERCEMYRAELLGAGLASLEELAPYFPGGEINNLENPVDAWTLAYARCFWLDGRRAGREVERESREGLEARQQEILKAQRAAPELVELVEPLEDGSPRIVYVHPKSAVALDEMKGRSIALAHLIDSLTLLEASPSLTLEEVELVLRAIAERRYLEHLLIWIAITPGCGLPYAEGTRAPELPSEHLAWTPADLYLVVNAFQRVNAGRAAALHAGGQSNSKPDFTGFYASMAIELGTPIRILARDYSLLELMATATEVSRTREEAFEASKARHRAEAA